jgi:hypothetical protein
MAELCAEAPPALRDGSMERISIVSLGKSGLVLNLYDVVRELGHKLFLDQIALKPGDWLVKASPSTGSI